MTAISGRYLVGVRRRYLTETAAWVAFAVGVLVYLVMAAVPAGAQSEAENVNDRTSTLGPLVALLLISIWVIGFGLSIRRARARRGLRSGLGDKPES